MSTVYRALDRESGVTVALKILAPDLIDTFDRFRREVALLAELEHPGIVRYVAHGVDGMTCFLAMEWIDGATLLDLLQDGLTAAESVTVVTRVAAALGVAHDRGVIHRDVKPSNILFRGGDLAEVQVIDFGIARRQGDVGSLTRTGVVLGTPGYMSPEQARAGVIDIRTDVFGLGCVLYECLTGRPAFSGEHPLALAAKILYTQPPLLSEICTEAPKSLVRLVDRMLAKAADDRPADAG